MSPRARAQLHELRRMWGKLRIVEGTEAEPTLIERQVPFGNFEVWRYLSGSGSKSIFEKQGGD